MMINKYNPNAAVIVYNYIDRQGDYELTEGSRDKIEEIILESELISIQTQKTKAQPSGSFTIVLAPIKNWVTVLTPGSWLSIHMSPKKIERKDKNKGGILSFGPQTLKMIGRIDTVQIAVQTNQETGARESVFIIGGRDWGQIFETMIYIDPMASVSGDDSLGQIVRAQFDSNLVKKDSNNFSTTNLINFFIDIWGTQTNAAKFKDSVRHIAGNKIDADRLMPESVFYIPKELHERFFFQGDPDGPSKLAHNINIVSGKLDGYDDYKDYGETGGVPNVGSIIGGNTLWQVLNAHCGSVVNELLTDFRWDKKRLMFTLYKRVRPFLLDKEATTPHGKNISSSFFNILKNEIKSENILNLQAGTNWRDKINFLEVLPQIGHVNPGYDFVTPMTKAKKSSAADYVSFGREGFKPLLFSTEFYPYKDHPYKDGTPAEIDSMYEWPSVMKKWYFNNHKMLNGTITISNQETYIGVGENIVLDGYLFSSSFHVENDATRGQKSKVLAHVESVSNSFSVDGNGSRNFTTTISFIRGVFTDETCSELLNPSSYGIDSDASKLQENDEKIINIYEVKND